jgi:hypothetical protein
MALEGEHCCEGVTGAAAIDVILNGEKPADPTQIYIYISSNVRRVTTSTWRWSLYSETRHSKTSNTVETSRLDRGTVRKSRSNHSDRIQRHEIELTAGVLPKVLLTARSLDRADSLRNDGFFLTISWAARRISTSIVFRPRARSSSRILV